MMFNKNGKIPLYFLLLIVGMILGGLLGGEFVRRLYLKGTAVDQSGQDTSANALKSQTKDHLLDNISTIRRTAIVMATLKVEPCVVGIVVTQLQLVGASTYSEDFFDLFFGPRLVPKFREVQNMGSGFIINDDGLILTNNHVVDGAQKLYVNFADGKQYEGTIVGQDPYADIAVVSVKGAGKKFKSIQFGNSADLMIGEWVIAIGNPFLNFFNDAQPTVTVGVVSALNRNFAPSENVYYQNMIQTDAAINPGNSGGPLVNAIGDVVGINAFIYTGNKRSSGSIGIGFAIPINSAKRVIQELVTYGARRQVWTGISVQDIDRATALALGLAGPEGVMIIDLQPDCPGQNAGLRVNDIIIQMGNRAIQSHADLDGFFVTYFPGDAVQVKVIRMGKTLEKKMILGEYHNK
jgi:serine protease Do